VQFSRLISYLSTLPSIAVNCARPRSPRGPTARDAEQNKFIVADQSDASLLAEAISGGRPGTAPQIRPYVDACTGVVRS